MCMISWLLLNNNAKNLKTKTLLLLSPHDVVFSSSLWDFKFKWSVCFYNENFLKLYVWSVMEIARRRRATPPRLFFFPSKRKIQLMNGTFFWQSSHTNFFSRLFMESFFKDPALLLLHCSAIIISNVRLSSKTFFLLTALRSPFSLFSMYLLILYLRPFSHWETNVFLFVPCRHVVDFLLSGSLRTVYDYPSKSFTIFQWDFYGRFYTVCLQGNDAGNLWKTRHFCQGHLLIIPGFTFRSTVAVKSFEDVKKFRFATFVLM